MVRQAKPGLSCGLKCAHHIKLFFGDHPFPHFHAVYGEYIGVFNIDSLDMIEGDLPKRAEKLVKEWAEMHKKELGRMWDEQKFYKLPPLE